MGRLASLASLLLACVLLAPAPAAAQTVNLHTSSIAVGGVGVPAFGIYCMDTSGYAQICSFGGGGGGGTVSQGAAGTGSADTWLTSDTALDALISGGALATSSKQSGTWSVGLAAGSNAIGSVSVSNLPATQAVSASALPLPSGAATAALQSSEIAAIGTPLQAGGSVVVTSLPSLPTGSNVIGTVFAEPSGASSLSLYRAINAASSSMAAAIKTSQAVLFMAEFCNSNASAVYGRLFNQTTAPTPGTSTVAIGGVIVPAASCATIAPAFGISLTTGLAVDVTSGSLADTDTTAITTASTVTVTVVYK